MFKSIKKLPRNVWAVGFTSFFMDISSEMVINILPLFLSNVLGVQTSVIGFIEGIAEATASLLKIFSGWLSDKLKGRKSLAVIGYSLSALSKPFFYLANSWGLIAGVRWADRVGKGIRTAPRDALVADSTTNETHGIAFGFNRAMDKAGAMLGLLIAAVVVWLAQANTLALSRTTFQTIVLISLAPALFAVLSLAFGVRDVPINEQREAPKFSLRRLGKPFNIFLVIVSIFTLGNSSDGFLILRAQSLGVSVTGILLMLALYNLVVALFATQAGGALGPRRPTQDDHQRLAGICRHLFRLCTGISPMASLAVIRCLRYLLQPGFRHRQCPGGRPGARRLTWHRLWHLPRRDRPAGLPLLFYRRHIMGRRGQLVWLWSQQHLLLRWLPGLASGRIAGHLDAKNECGKPII